MVSRFRVGPDEVRIVERHDEVPEDHEQVPLGDKTSASAVVRSLGADSANRHELFSLLSRIDPVAGMLEGERERLERVARLLAEGELRLARRKQPHWQAGGGRAMRPTEQRAPEPARPESSWIELRVVDDETGRPYADVAVVVTLPDGSEQNRSTDSDGTVSIASCPRGIAKATSELPDAKLAATLAYVGMGERALVDEEAPEAPPKGPLQIRPVEEHRVRSGETLESVAKAAGLSWQTLAQFNWGTASPAEVNKHLRFELGCTRRDASGDNMVFDDADEPGVLYVPRPFRLASLATDRAHSLRVRRLRPVLAVRLDDPFLGFVADTAVEVTYADGSSEQLRTDEDGVVEVKTDRWSDQGNFADLKVTTELREHAVRVFLVLEHATERNGAWQRLCNLGYVPIEEPKLEPDTDELFAAALEEFQADAGLSVTGKLDRNGARVLAEWHRASRSWGEHDLYTWADPDDEHTRSKAEVA